MLMLLNEPWIAPAPCTEIKYKFEAMDFDHICRRLPGGSRRRKELFDLAGAEARRSLGPRRRMSDVCSIVDLWNAMDVDGRVRLELAFRDELALLDVS